MLRAGLRRWRTPAAALAALLAAPAIAVSSASAARADAVRQQEQWVLNALDVAGAWQQTQGSGVTVALIDSGVNGQVSDLTGSVTTGRDFSGVNTPSTNTNWGVHGTWMASLIAGHGHPPAGTSGITGIAPAAKILSIRAVTDQGDPGYHRYQHESESRVQNHLADAIKYATSKRVSVISMSLGYQGPSLAVRAAISAALAQGIVVVASSGNSGGASSGQRGNAPYSFPADYPGVLGVGAVAQSGQPAGFSSDNLSVQVAAPGVRVPAQGRDGQYWLVSGTSPACALTAGVAALIKSVYPALAPALVVQAITASASNQPHGGYDEQVGSGTVDATAALKMAGRLAKDQGTGRGLVAAAQFGGGPAAIPAVPVTPRDKRQLLIDSLIALAFLAAVLVVVFRLIATRRPAVVGVPGGWSPGGASPAWGTGPGASPGWTQGPGAPAGGGPPVGGGGPAGSRGPAGPGGLAGPGGPRVGPGGPAGSVPAGWAAGAASDAWGAGSGAPGGRGGAGVSGPGAMGPGAATPGAAGRGAAGPGGAGPGSLGAVGSGAVGSGAGGSGAGDAWPSGSGYGRSAGYWASGGYKPPAGLPPPAESGFQRPANSGPPADSWSADGYPPPGGARLAGGYQPPATPGRPADSVPPAGYEGPVAPAPPAGYPGPVAPAPPAGAAPTDGFRQPTDPGAPTGYGPPRGPLPGGNGRAAGYPPPAGPHRPASPAPPPPSNGSGPAGHGPLAGYQPHDELGDGPAAPGRALLPGAAGGSGFAGSRFTDDQGLPARPDGPTVPGAPRGPGFPGAAGAPGVPAPDVDTGPLAGHRDATGPQDGRADDVPPADDDTWPSSGSW